MPRTPRAAASDSTPVTEGEIDPQAAAPEPAADPNQESAPTSPRRRRTRAATSTPDLEAPVAAEVGDLTPIKRRGGRRTKAGAEPVPGTELAAPIETEAPVMAAETPSSAARPRRGRARKAAVEAEATPEPLDITSKADTASLPDPAVSEPVTPKPLRGRRRRTSAAPDTAAIAPEDSVSLQALPDVEAPVVGDTPAASSEAEPVRQRRGRRRHEAVVSPEATEPTETEAEDTVEAAEKTSAETEGARRGRRRRSRRRRGGEIEDSGDLVEGTLLPEEPVGEMEDPDDLELGLPLISPVVPVYVAPPLVPPVLPPAAGAPLPRVHAQVALPVDGRGLAQIVVEDQPHAPFFFFVNTETALSGDVVDSQIRAAAAAGIHLYSGVMYLPLKNAYGDRSFGAIDALLQQVLAADPQAYLLPRLQCVPTNYWVRTHPEQMTRYADGSEGDVSMASTEFWADCVDALEALIAHLADPATTGGDRVIGFHLDRGEWFYDREAGYDFSDPNVTAFQNWLHAKYQQPYALRAAWFQGDATFEDASVPQWNPATGKPDPMPVYSNVRDGRWPDYAMFASELVAQAITSLAEIVKTLTEGRLLVAASYGYSMEFATRNDSGHLALAHVLQSPHVDILAGPNSYTNRGAGSPSSFGAPLDSVALHGKLWLVEDDTKTFLAETETEDTYNPKIAGGADTQAAHQRHFGAALAHGAGVTWMDLWGQGWLDSPDIWQELGHLRDQANRLAQVAPSGSPGPDIVVLVDEVSLAYLKSNPAGLGLSLVTKTRDLLLRTGASVGFYLQSDVTHPKLPDAKLYLFLNALRVTTTEKLAIREKLQRSGKTLAWVYAAGVFNENGLAEEEIGETVGMTVRLQPWNARLGSQLTDTRHPLTERLRGSKKTIGQDEVLNPSYSITDSQATTLAEYTTTGAVSLAAREHPGGWKSVFFGDPHLTADLLRGLLTYAGVPLFDTQDDVTYAGSNGVLTVHAPFTGQRTLLLPRQAAVYDVMEDRIVSQDTRSFRTFMRSRTTRLFLWGDRAAVSEATGLSLPAAEAEVEDTLPEEMETSLSTEMPLSAPLLTSTETIDTTSNEVLSSLVADILTPTPALLAAEMEQFAAQEDYFDVGGVEIALLPEEGVLGEDEAAGGEARTSAPRSRWQRRRAAMRAKREAERQAQQGEPGAPAAGNAAVPPVDIAALLPGLPPRRMPSSPPPPAAESDDE